MAGLERSWNNDVSLATLQPASSFPELYVPLWWYSGAYANANNVATTLGTAFVPKGNTLITGTSSSSVKLFTLSSTWPATTKFAFEASLWVNAGTGRAELWDLTTGTAVSSSAISTGSTTPTVIRSSQFTLTPGHQYGITFCNDFSGDSVSLTDASLIVFPSSPLTSPSVSAISLANPSGNTLKEAYIPLWVYSSGSSYNGNSATTAGSAFLQKGTTNSVTTSPFPVLLTLSNSWNANQKFALEVSMRGNSGYSDVELWDITSNTGVSLSHIEQSPSVSTFTVIRSGSFTLTAGHNYGVTYWSLNGGTYNCYLTKAHLVALA